MVLTRNADSLEEVGQDVGAAGRPGPRVGAVVERRRHHVQHGTTVGRLVALAFQFVVVVRQTEAAAAEAGFYTRCLHGILNDGDHG